MKTVTIYGASDDLIEIEGDLGRHEFDATNDEADDLLFSTGCKVRVTYDEEGCWRINLLTNGCSTVVEHKLATDPDGDYTDRLTITGDFEWVEHWPASGIARDEIVCRLEDTDFDDVEIDTLLTVLRLLQGHLAVVSIAMHLEAHDQEAPVNE